MKKPEQRIPYPDNISVCIEALTTKTTVEASEELVENEVVTKRAYASKNGRSYAEQLKTAQDMDFCMVIVPIVSDVKTDEAHAKARVTRYGSESSVGSRKENV